MKAVWEILDLPSLSLVTKSYQNVDTKQI